MLLLQALYFFIPAYIANMAPVFVKKINFLNYPVDFNKSWNGKRILGSHKTWRGFFFGTIAGFLVFELQKLAFKNGIMTGYALIDYASAPLFLGFLLAFSALLGDSIKSFFKRRLNIIPGRPWLLFDQLDFLVAAMIITAPWSGITMNDSLLMLGVVLILTIIVQFIGYKLKLKDDML